MHELNFDGFGECVFYNDVIFSIESFFCNNQYELYQRNKKIRETRKSRHGTPDVKILL